MNFTGCDTASSALHATELRDARCDFVGRYVSTPGNPKNITWEEANELTAFGIKIVTIFESTAQRALDGFNAGVFDAREAAMQAYEAGQPFGTPIYYTVDFDMQSAKWAAVSDYLQGAYSASNHYKVGAYGGLLLATLIQRHTFVPYRWQASAWSHGQWASGVNIRQVGTTSVISGQLVDDDVADLADYGGWQPVSPANQPPIGGPTPPAPPSTWMAGIMQALPTLQQGSADPVAGQFFVRRLQAFLRDVAGQNIGDTGVDGEFGPATLGAVKAFQQNRHLTVDGIVGPLTWSYVVTGTAR